jgi:hypothetical protein
VDYPSSTEDSIMVDNLNTADIRVGKTLDMPDHEHIVDEGEEKQEGEETQPFPVHLTPKEVFTTLSILHSTINLTDADHKIVKEKNSRMCIKVTQELSETKIN